jgi:precorrin-2 dehydrogenase/sirohydrochlorin ferrochelatase
MIDVSDRLVLIVGGGTVASRKAKGLLAAGANRVRCISPMFDKDMPDAVERVQGLYEPGHLEGAGLVFAATDSREVNDAVVREARRRGVLVNRADTDEDEPGDFTVPAVWRGSEVTVAVSAGGSAALAAVIRDDLAGKVDERHLRMAEVMKRLRPMILASPGMDAKRRAEALREIVSEEAMSLLASDGEKGLTEWLKTKYPEMQLEIETK